MKLLERQTNLTAAHPPLGHHAGATCIGILGYRQSQGVNVAEVALSLQTQRCIRAGRFLQIEDGFDNLLNESGDRAGGVEWGQRVGDFGHGLCDPKVSQVEIVFERRVLRPERQIAQQRVEDAGGVALTFGAVGRRQASGHPFEFRATRLSKRAAAKPAAPRLRSRLARGVRAGGAA